MQSSVVIDYVGSDRPPWQPRLRCARIRRHQGHEHVVAQAILAQRLSRCSAGLSSGQLGGRNIKRLFSRTCIRPEGHQPAESITIRTNSSRWRCITSASDDGIVCSPWTTGACINPSQSRGDWPNTRHIWRSSICPAAAQNSTPTDGKSADLKHAIDTTLSARIKTKPHAAMGEHMRFIAANADRAPAI